MMTTAPDTDRDTDAIRESIILLMAVLGAWLTPDDSIAMPREIPPG